jgi:hypothetical protein
MERARPAKPLKPRRDLGVIHVWIIAAAGADELEHAVVAAFDVAVHDADRLAPHERRPAVAGLTGKREYHPDCRPHAQPWVTAILHTRRGDGGRTDTRSVTGPGVMVTKSTHSTHRPASHSRTALPRPVIPALPGSGAARLFSRDDTRSRCAAKCPAELGQSLVKPCFPVVYLGVEWRSGR